MEKNMVVKREPKTLDFDFDLPRRCWQKFEA